MRAGPVNEVAGVQGAGVAVVADDVVVAALEDGQGHAARDRIAEVRGADVAIVTVVLVVLVGEAVAVVVLPVAVAWRPRPDLRIEGRAVREVRGSVAVVVRITDIPQAVQVRVGLIRVGQGRAVVERVGDAVAVQVDVRVRAAAVARVARRVLRERVVDLARGVRGLRRDVPGSIEIRGRVLRRGSVVRGGTDVRLPGIDRVWRVVVRRELGGEIRRLDVQRGVGQILLHRHGAGGEQDDEHGRNDAAHARGSRVSFVHLGGYPKRPARARAAVHPY